jgi:hypothetical protein
LMSAGSSEDIRMLGDLRDPQKIQKNMGLKSARVEKFG